MVAEPEIFPCGPLNGLLTERACQNNQRRALAEEAAGKYSFIARCLTCTSPIKKLETPRKDQPMPKAGAESPKCKTHPDRDAVINKRGVSTGKCQECIVANGKAGGRLTGNPVLYMLREPRHQELLKFLQESAEENERTLEQEVVYRLKKTI